MNSSDNPIEIHRADANSIEAAFAIVTQYYEAFQVWERETLEDFQAHYFGHGNGFWLAMDGLLVVGCIGLRAMPDLSAGLSSAGEVKRLYVQPEYRRRHIADRLLQALEEAAAAYRYEWLYLDSTETFTDAPRFYRRHGYQDCERYNSNRQATIFMRKRVDLLRKDVGGPATGS